MVAVGKVGGRIGREFVSAVFKTDNQQGPTV